MALRLDLKVMAQMIMDNNLPLPQIHSFFRVMAVSKVLKPLLDALLRLIYLLDEPSGIPILSPLDQHDIYYRIPVGDEGL
jgi:hypothetical protein